MSSATDDLHSARLDPPPHGVCITDSLAIRNVLDRHIVDTSAQKSPQQNVEPCSIAIGTFVHRISSENSGSGVRAT